MAVEEVAATVGIAPACRALGMARSTLYRHRQPASEGVVQTRKSYRALTEVERENVLSVLHSERFVDQSPAEIYATLLDEGRYLCSIRTMYRIQAGYRPGTACHPCRSRLIHDIQAGSLFDGRAFRVTKTHSRPYTSNDNPYSESQFKTLKV